MFNQSPTFSSYSIDSVPAARAFYGGTLGLEVDERPEGLALKLGGGGYLFLYPKPNHRPATFTVLNFHVPNIEEAVSGLKMRGVQFLQYDEPDLKTDARGIHFAEQGPRAIAWFKDPAGNILALLQPR
ncbi:MAG TPA: VOC family protein [Polyangia bacterium]|jgi:catechol 2,3-dioxygenase-like lactoylglutathione lyase family enzyme